MNQYMITIEATAPNGRHSTHRWMVNAEHEEDARKQAKGLAGCYVGKLLPNGDYEGGTVTSIEPYTEAQL